MHICWICKNKCLSQNTICNCKNEISFVHENCLIKWIIASNNLKCRFCNSNYKLSNINVIFLYTIKIKLLIVKIWNEIEVISQIMLDDHIIF